MDADDPRGMDARRADIFTDLLLGRDVRGEKQTTIEVQVNLDAATLAYHFRAPPRIEFYTDIQPHPGPPPF